MESEMSTAILFPDRDRTLRTPTSKSRSMYELLDELGGVYWERVRQLMSSWVDAYPADSRAKMMKDLTLRKGWQVRSAYWELAWFNVLTRAGATVTCHPSVSGTTKKPDFLVEGLGDPFLFEAKVIEDPEEIARRDAKERAVWSGLNDRVFSEHFFLRVEVRAFGPGAAPVKRLADEVRQWLLTLENDVERLRDVQQTLGHESMPILPWRDEASGWSMDLSPMVKTQPESTDRIVGMSGVLINLFDDRGAVREAVRSKARRYGSDPPYPLVLAVGLARGFADAVDVTDALFGDDLFTLPADRRLPPYSTRENGLWSETDGRRVSAVIAGRLVQPWSVASWQARMWVNPWAARPLNLRLLTVGCYEPIGDAMEYHASPLSFSRLFSLEPAWPGPEPDFDR